PVGPGGEPDAGPDPCAGRDCRSAPEQRVVRPDGSDRLTTGPAGTPFAHGRIAAGRPRRTGERARDGAGTGNRRGRKRLEGGRGSGSARDGPNPGERPPTGDILRSPGARSRHAHRRSGALAAWLILQHAIGNPPLMRRGLTLLRGGVSEGEVSPLEVAMLEDRIRTFEGRPQRYGTQFDWDEHGRLSPLPLEDPAGVDAR